MSWIAVGAAAVTVVGGAISANQANKGAQGAANAQERMSQAAIDEQRRQFDLSRGDMAPWMQAGSGALSQMQALNSGDFSSFHASPDYTFSFGEGQRALDSGAAARGGLFGGAHSRDAIKYGQGMAEQQYGNYYARLQSMAGQGQTTASGLGTLGANMANNIGNQYNNMGTARASAYNQQGQNNAQLWAGVAGAGNNLFQNYMAQRNSGGGYSSSGGGLSGFGGSY